MPLALEGTRILDLSQYGPGAYCTMLLADMGADVIKVEDPATSARRNGPAPTGQADAERRAAYNAHGRNKRSITLNLKSEAARQVFYELVKTADVVVEGFRPGTATRLGVDYDALKEMNPRIVYCSISGYGQDGPYRDLAGHDVNYIGVAGALSLIGRRGGPPVIPHLIIGDYAAGSMHAVMGILTALLARQRLGVGQYVDVSMTDGVISLMSQIFAEYFESGVVPGPGESIPAGGTPGYRAYETKDGKYIAIGNAEPRHYAAMCRALGREDLIEHQKDPEKREETFAIFRQIFKTRTREEWFANLRQFDNCVAPVYGLDEVCRDPQVLARNMLVEVEHPTLGKVKQVGIAAKLSATPGTIRSLAPARGQHTDEILSALGYAESDIRSLREEGAV